MRWISTDHWRRVACLLAAGVLLAAGAANARTIAVPDDAPTITAAMARAAAGDIILVSCGVYQESDIQVTSGVSLWSGTLQTDCVVIDAGGRGRALVFTDCDTTTTVVGFTLRGGYSDGDGGAILCRDASPRLSRCLITESRARRGGGVACLGSSAPRLEDCTITDNEADLQGGGILWDAHAPGRLVRCSMSDNRALAGGGLACLGGDGLRLVAATVQDNQAAASGGGLWIGGGTVVLQDCLLARNHGGLAGGAIACRDGRPLLAGCTLVDNGVEVLAGGLLVRGGSPRLERSIIAFNDADAVSVTDGGRLDLAACDIYGHDGGDWTAAVAAQAHQGGNFSLDPRFCSRRSGVYDLSAGSPCLPGRRAGNALIGARGRGCD